MPYETTEFVYSVHNDAPWRETAYLVPTGLPWGATLEITPAEAVIASGGSAIFRCTLTVDQQIIRPGCSNDQRFLLTAWRVAYDADERWGSCLYFVRPRLATRVAITHSSWVDSHLIVIGTWQVTSDQPFDLGRNPAGDLRLRVAFTGATLPPLWRTTRIEPGGGFRIDLDDVDMDSTHAVVQAYYERTDLYASAVSPEHRIRHETAVVVE